MACVIVRGIISGMNITWTGNYLVQPFSCDGHSKIKKPIHPYLIFYVGAFS